MWALLRQNIAGMDGIIVLVLVVIIIIEWKCARLGLRSIEGDDGGRKEGHTCFHFRHQQPRARAHLARGGAATVLVVTINETAFKTPGKKEVVRGEPAGQV